MKFLDTNISVERFISSLRNTEQNLPSLLNEWEILDDELKQEYSEQLCWLLSKAAEYMEKDTSICNGCGEMRYKCYCEEECPYCGKQLYTCTSESESGWCPQDPNLKKYLVQQSSINKKE